MIELFEGPTRYAEYTRNDVGFSYYIRDPLGDRISTIITDILGKYW